MPIGHKPECQVNYPCKCGGATYLVQPRPAMPTLYRLMRCRTCKKEFTTMETSIKSLAAKPDKPAEVGEWSKYGNCLEYKVWVGMLQRCYNQDDVSYHNYGGRGISVCQKWRKSFVAFRDDVGPRPSVEYSIDRINNDGHYEPGNCRWATRKEQAQNSRRHLVNT